VDPTAPKRILVVANRTVVAPRLLDEIRRRARASPCRFTLLVPDVATARDADWTLDTAQRLLAKAAGAPVGGLTGGPDPLNAVKDAVATGDFDEIIISTLPLGVSRWLGMDLPHRAERKFKLPVTTVIARS
jgi:GABA permease